MGPPTTQQLLWRPLFSLLPVNVLDDLLCNLDKKISEETQMSFVLFYLWILGLADIVALNSQHHFELRSVESITWSRAASWGKRWDPLRALFPRD